MTQTSLFDTTNTPKLVYFKSSIYIIKIVECFLIFELCRVDSTSSVATMPLTSTTPLSATTADSSLPAGYCAVNLVDLASSTIDACGAARITVSMADKRPLLQLAGSGPRLTKDRALVLSVADGKALKLLRLVLSSFDVADTRASLLFDADVVTLIGDSNAMLDGIDLNAGDTRLVSMQFSTQVFFF